MAGSDAEQEGLGGLELVMAWAAVILLLAAIAFVIGATLLT